MPYQITIFFRWLKWLKNGRPNISYPGYHCGLCGSWTWAEFKIPEYKSAGKWWDTIKVCQSCERG